MKDNLLFASTIALAFIIFVVYLDVKWELKNNHINILIMLDDIQKKVKK